MNTAFPERISQARESVGLSKTDLAQRLEVSVAAVTQWENGTKHPTTENLLAIARVVEVPMQLLLTPIPRELANRGPVTFRARSAVKTTRLRKQAQRFAEMAAEAFIWLEDWVSFPTASLPEIPTNTDVEQAAAHCRRAWGLGDRPITKLGELLELKGIRLCSAAFGEVQMDAYSCIINGRAFVFLTNFSKDRARCRFDAAHELAHLLLHQHLSDEELEQLGQQAENDANAFASAFLLPADTFSKDVADTSLDGFKRLKPKWGVSVQAMVRRAKDLELISEATYDRHCRQMSVLGWRRAKGEPLDEMVPKTVRTLGKRSLEMLASGNRIQPWEIPNSLPLPESVLNSVFDTDVRKMVPGEINNIIVLTQFTGAGGGSPNTAG